MKKILVTLVVAFSLVLNVNAFELSSENAILYNLNENKIIYEENKDEQTSIASLTKIMTTLVAIEHITDMDKKVTMTSDMFEGLTEANAAVIDLTVGQKVTYEDLLYGMFIASGADATRGIAISLAGSEDAFVEWMNEKASELGLSGTHFVNTTGLDEDDHYSTVSDVATLLIKALDNATFKTIFTSTSHTLSDGSMTIYSTLKKNAAIYGLNVDYIEGAKTGYTYDAGKCLASLAYDEVNDIEYLLVTTNASISTDNAYHILDATKVYSYYFNNYKYNNLVDKGDLILTLPTKYGKVSEVNLYASEDIKYYLENTFNKEDVTLDYSGVDVIKTGMDVGDKLGTIDVIYNSEVLKTFDVLLQEKVDFSLAVFLKENILAVLIVLALIALLTFIKIKSIKRKHRKKRRK